MIPQETKTWVPITLQASQEEIPVVVSAEREFFVTQEGERYIDGISSWWTVIHGHRHPHLMEALKKQTEKLDHFMLGGFLNEEAEELSEKILSLANHQFHKVFYSDNGSNAVEIALKLSVQYYENRDARKGEGSKKKFIVFSHSYHGDSIGAMSVSGTSYFNRVFRSLQFPVLEKTAPDCHACPWKKKPDTCQTECLDDVADSLQREAHLLAGVVIEPLVFGAFGMKMYSPKVLKKLKSLCSEHDVHLILDEVFTGMGRLGTPFAFQKAGVLPDLVALAKGLTGGALPLGATLVSKEIYNSFVSLDPERAFFHAHTMTGNSLACRTALASLEIFLGETYPLLPKLEQRLSKLGQAISQAWGDRITPVRVQGSVLAWEILGERLSEDEYLLPLGKKLAKQLWKEKVFLRPLGNTLYLTLPYNTEESSFELIEEAFWKCAQT